MLRPSRHLVESEAKRLALLTAIAAVLYAAAGVGMAYVAGFDAVRARLLHPVWWWLAISAGVTLLSFVGYYFGYRGVGKVEGGPDDLTAASRLAVVSAGFGGFLAHGGSGLDEFVMRAAGADEREARVRVTLLAGLEHGILAFPCSLAAIYLLVRGIDKPPHDFTIPWAVGPAVGFAIAFWVAHRYRKAWRSRDGWRGKTSILLDGIHLIGVMFRRPGTYAAALGGTLLFWLADMFALWAAMAAFGFRMNGGSEVVAFGTAMIVTRRTGPLGGAGILGCALPPTLWISGAPFAAAVLGTFAYRFFTLWLPQPAAFASLPRLRTLLDRARGPHGTRADVDEPALQQ
jgi:uncharacterized membrane protein YbhN (UPF0104 family)